MKKKSIVQVEKLRKVYEGKAVVNDISFEVIEGEIFGILGPNGAGKTTTLEMIEALRPIDGGQVLLDGLDVAMQPDAVKEIIGIQLQSTSFFDKLSLREQLRMFNSMYAADTDPDKLLAEV